MDTSVDTAAALDVERSLNTLCVLEYRLIVCGDIEYHSVKRYALIFKCLEVLVKVLEDILNRELVVLYCCTHSYSLCIQL